MYSVPSSLYCQYTSSPKSPESTTSAGRSGAGAAASGSASGGCLSGSGSGSGASGSTAGAGSSAESAGVFSPASGTVPAARTLKGSRETTIMRARKIASSRFFIVKPPI